VYNNRLVGFACHNLINKCAFGCFRCSCSVCQPTFPCFSSLNFSICRRTWDVERLPCTGSRWLGAPENVIDLDVYARLNLPVNGERSSIGMASSEISVETLGKTTADLKLLDQTYRSSNFRVWTKKGLNDSCLVQTL